ncbi:hypothetical protein Tco_1017669 [Tanacetum coccineum]|uniref:Uncharacterized protein n=1 Tax=Tanacetum coccineum TaxID=301880 RepID=A0ABQ5FSK0_9ASTR
MLKRYPLFLEPCEPASWRIKSGSSERCSQLKSDEFSSQRNRARYTDWGSYGEEFARTSDIHRHLVILLSSRESRTMHITVMLFCQSLACVTRTSASATTIYNHTKARSSGRGAGVLWSTGEGEVCWGGGELGSVRMTDVSERPADQEFDNRCPGVSKQNKKSNTILTGFQKPTRLPSRPSWNTSIPAGS